jgi:protoporphyrinogen oxidase
VSVSADFVVLGGGVAGLTIAREIARAGRSVTIVERGNTVGGLARTFRQEGFSFDLGGHRFHSNNPDTVGWLQQLMGADLLRVHRLSRIYLRGRFIDYPIRLAQATRAFGTVKALHGAASYLSALAIDHRQDAVTFEDWVTRRFGRVLYKIYFKPYCAPSCLRRTRRPPSSATSITRAWATALSPSGWPRRSPPWGRQS